VMVPFQGSGGITASIIGRAVGMPNRLLISGVAVGAITAGIIIAYAAKTGMMLLMENMVTGIIIILLGLLAALVTLLAFRLSRMRRWGQGA
jgi:hypothetical protein